MTARFSSPPPFPLSLPPLPRRRPTVLDEPDFDFDRDPMRRQLQPTSAMMMPRRPSPVRRELSSVPMPAPVQAIVDELGDLLALDEQVGSGRSRADEFARPSWCTHEGVTVTRVGHRTCLRCGAVLGG